MSLSRPAFDYIRTLVQQRSAIVLDDDKAYLAESRLDALARREGLLTVDDLVTRLRIGPDNSLHREVVEAMTTNETSFFRDHYPFEGLRLVVLPELIRRRSAERSLRIWCAACSSGQEPYSVALLLREHFPELGSWSVRIVASDLSTDVLDRARQGRYSQLEVNRGLPPRMLEKYFHKQGADWQIAEDLRRLVEFRPLNLIGPWPALPALDVVLLRNVLIYFDVTSKKTVLGKIRQVLRSDGYLFLGGAETTLNLDDAFERVQFDWAGCYRLGKRP